MKFSEAESYLYSLGNEVETMKLGLENTRVLLSALGNPHENYKKVQVAGTNGKGSVCAFLNSICLQAGIMTGLYTSPHLVSITERIKINGEDIGENEFARFATRVRETAEKLLAEGELQYRPTFFEQVTAIALLAFAEAKVELAILETGMGGRLDATTASNAEICAITQIALDHQEYLGETIEEIAAEKAAIIQPVSKVVLMPQAKEVERVLTGRCREVGVEPYWATKHIDIKRDPDIAPVLFGTFKTENAVYARVDLNYMLGAHQFDNASVAITLTELLHDEGFKISNDNICIGLETATHPGRLEWINSAEVQILLDGAHNVSGAEALADYLTTYHPEASIALVYGSMKGKDVGSFLKILSPLVKDIILTAPESSRTLSAGEITAAISGFVEQDKVFVVPNVGQALDSALELAKTYTATRQKFVLVTGSLYLVGEVKKLLNN